MICTAYEDAPESGGSGTFGSFTAFALLEVSGNLALDWIVRDTGSAARRSASQYTKSDTTSVINEPRTTARFNPGIGLPAACPTGIGAGATRALDGGRLAGEREGGAAGRSVPGAAADAAAPAGTIEGRLMVGGGAMGAARIWAITRVGSSVAGT